MAVWVAGTGRFGGPRVSLCEDGLAQWRCEWGGVVVWLGGPWLCEDWLAFWRSVTDRPLPLLPSPSPHSRSRPLLSPPPSLPTPQACRICGARNHRLDY